MTNLENDSYFKRVDGVVGTSFFNAKLLSSYSSVTLSGHKKSLHDKDVKYVNADKVREDGKIRWEFMKNYKAQVLKPSELAHELNNFIREFRLKNPHAEFTIHLDNGRGSKLTVFAIPRNNKVYRVRYSTIL